MPRHSVAPYQVGDRLVSGANVAHVRSREGREGPYLSALVAEGPRAGEWVRPERFAPPAVDWHPEGHRGRCADCDREFRRPPAGSTLVPPVLCLQCHRQQQAREQPRERDRGLVESTWRRKVYASEGAGFMPRPDDPECPF